MLPAIGAIVIVAVIMRMIVGVVVRMVVVVTGHRVAFLVSVASMRQWLRHHGPESEEHSIELAIVSAELNRGMELIPASTRQEYPMSSTTDKIKGTANEAIGKAKQGIGEAVGSDRLQGEGLIQEGKGHAQKVVGDAKQAAKDAVDKASDFAHKKF
ncbi:uncharacterized protein YjbJ (UPF0337 family) [Nitrobacteraceae bacterium AZCC 2146]